LESRLIPSALNPSRSATEISLSLVDPVSVNDFYILEITGLTASSSDRVRPSIWIPNSVEEIETPCNYQRNARILYEDNCFNGQLALFVVAAENEVTRFSGSIVVREPLASLEVRFMKISEELFEYWKTNEVKQGIELAFFEPSFLIGNIENGYGVFGSASQKDFVVKSK
jgi:hypothetical protein